MLNLNRYVLKSLRLAALVALVSVAFSVLPASAQSTPEAVAKALVAAESSHNVDAAVASFTADAVVTLPTGVLKTTDDIRKWQTELAAGHFNLEALKMKVDGNNVSWTGEISLDLFRQMGIASLGGNWALVIDNGKVKTFNFSWTPDGQTKLQTGGVAAGLIAAESTHDVDAAVASFAPDAVVTLPTGVLKTTDDIRKWQTELAAGNFRIEPEGRTVKGDTISWTGEISLDLFRQMGIASLGGNWVLVVKDGKVKTFDFSWTPDGLTKLQTGSVAAALIAAESTHNVDAAVASFAADAVVTLPTGVLKTTADIQNWQKELAAGNFRIEPEGLHVDGDTVSWTGQISLDLFRQMGISSLGGNWVLVVKDGKVKTFDFSWTPEAAKALEAAKPS